MHQPDMHQPGDIEPFLVNREGGRDRASGLSYRQARHRQFLLTSRGVRLPTPAEGREFSRWAAAQLPLRGDCVLSHATAARLLGLPLPLPVERQSDIHVTAPRNTSRPRRRDIVTHHSQLPDEDVMSLWGLRITRPARTYVDMASMLSFDHLVALGDVALAKHHLTPADLLAVAERRLRYPGRGRAMKALNWLDEKAESPRESLLRVMLRRAGLPRPEVNLDILDARGNFLARGDLVFRRERVIAEYDGQVHASMEQRAKDAARRARLRENGWIVVEIVGADMHDPERVVDRVRRALADGRARGGA